MGKDGHIGIVLQASNPIQSDEDFSPVISSRVNEKQKRAISQNYSLNKDLRAVENNAASKRRKFGTNHHSLSDVGTSIMNQNEY